MPHIDFNYDGLGEARRVFSQKHARLLKVRETEEQRLADSVHQAEQELAAQRAVLGGPVPGSYIIDLYDQHRDWTSRVLRTVREMVLTYLVAMADAFVGRWREENGLPPGQESKWWCAATEHEINETLKSLHEKRSDIPLLSVRADVAMRLAAIRAQRKAVIHRDSEGVDDITEEDLDAALLTVDSLVRALAFITHRPLPYDRDDRERRRAFIAEAFSGRG